MTVINFQLAKQALENRAAVRSGREYCDPCYQERGFVSFLIKHRDYNAPTGVGWHCVECGEEFED